MPDDRSTFQFVTDRGDARLRLDQILRRRVTNVSRISRSLTQQWILAGRVQVAGACVRRAAARVGEGTAVSVALPEATRLRTVPAAERGALEIVFEDASLLIVNKPPGLVVHPSYKQTGGTLLNAVLWHLESRGCRGAEPGIVTRLDKETSGLVLIALTADAHRRLQREATAGRVGKTYVAVVRGRPRPREGRLRSPIGRDPADRRRMVIDPHGAPSETGYRVLAERPGTAGVEAIVECALVTGRTHQIRVHLSAAGWPIVGDRTYGQRDDRIDRQALHAQRVTLSHPITGMALDVSAAIPADMQRLVDGFE